MSTSLKRETTLRTFPLSKAPEKIKRVTVNSRALNAKDYRVVGADTLFIDPSKIAEGDQIKVIYDVATEGSQHEQSGHHQTL